MTTSSWRLPEEFVRKEIPIHAWRDDMYGIATERSLYIVAIDNQVPVIYNYWEDDEGNEHPDPEPQQPEYFVSGAWKFGSTPSGSPIYRNVYPWINSPEMTSVEEVLEFVISNISRKENSRE